MTAAEYTRLLRAARRAQLAQNEGAVRGVDALLSRVAQQLRVEIAETPRGILGERYRKTLLASIQKAANEFRDQYRSLLDSAIRQAADLSAQAEATLERAATMGMTRSVAITFGSVAQQAIERAYLRTYSDGLRLSERLYKLDQETRRSLTETVMEGIAKGESAKNLGKRITTVLTANATDTVAIADREKRREESLKAAREAKATGQTPKPVPQVENIKYRAIRIARTETNLSYREGQVASVTKPDGTLKDHIRALGWRLSPSHPRIDICDHWASEDTGLGPGNYLPEDLPGGHPCCLCHVVSLLHELPEMEFVQLPPQPDKVPAGQLAYYGKQNDA